MRITRIYTPQDLSSGLELDLESQASIHLSRVLRKAAGDSVEIFNGLGKAFSAEISSISKKAVTVSIQEELKSDIESPLMTEIGVAVSKGDKMDLIIQKTTELGINTISPIITKRSDVKLNQDRWQKKQQHWHQVAISACEQSGRNVIPHIRPVMSFSEWLGQCTCEEKLILHPHQAKPLELKGTHTSIAMCFGSEGGFTNEEIQEAQNSGFKLTCLGPRILRAETAPIALLGIIQANFGDLA